MDQSGWEFTVGIDLEVWEALKAQAEPFLDTPNSVLRRLLALDPPGDGRAALAPSALSDHRERESSPRRRAQARRASSNGKAPERKRAPRGSLLPEQAYERPILEVLEKRGGRVPTREVIEEVGSLVGDQLTPLDREELSAGVHRWQKRVQFTRLRLVERGLVQKDSPRGVWEITDEGRRSLEAQDN